MSVVSRSLAPLSVLGPPDSVPSVIPTETRAAQCLPFGDLSWENFERLCHRMIAREADVEHCARYGQQGEAQEGIDIFARRSDGRYDCLQAKRHRVFGSSKMREAVDMFLAGSWADDTVQFTIAVQTSLGSVAVQTEIERQAKRLKEREIVFRALDGEGLTGILRNQPLLVDDFFGRAWVSALAGHDVAKSLGDRLDGAAFARVRSQLARVYNAKFQSVDPGSFGSIADEDGRGALTLLERFLKPDMLVRESGRTAGVSKPDRDDKTPGIENVQPAPAIKISDSNPPPGSIISSRMRRLPLVEWLGDSERMVVLGEAGSGKSTLLRVVALDLLHDQAHFPELAARWGQHIPVYIPFAQWSSQAARDGSSVGLKEIVRRSLQPYMTGSIVDLLDQAIDDQRVLLIIDGLDEWSSEQAARSTLSALVTTVEAHAVPVIVSGRPRGLNRIGTIPAGWKRGTVAPLLPAQQAIIAGRWFQRYAVVAPDRMIVSDGGLRTGRFMAELARDPNLAAIAAVPLLLIGLVTLALRGQILPRTKSEVYDQLVRVLLEIHPTSRATASGDTEERFRHTTDAGQRRAAIARLAFAIRTKAGGAGISLADATEILRDYLASPKGFALANAEGAAKEILSVNAETQGLIVEKAPGEVGFVHASFEEYLGAEHVYGWPFSEIEAFVSTNSGDARWRNVIANLMGLIRRRDEFDRLVAIIEEQDLDELGCFSRQALLGDIAFGPAVQSPATAKRLALDTMRRVESEDWLPARREALASAVRGLADPTLKADVEQRLGRWLPARLAYRLSLIGEFAGWGASAALQDVLWQAMHDEDPGVQRGAAAAYAEVFAASTEAGQRLVAGLARTRDLSAAAAMLESLALGWPTAAGVAALFDEAWRTQGGELQLAGILGLVKTDATPEAARDIVLRGQQFWSNLSYPYRDLAAAMLMKYWPGDDELVSSALQRLSGDFNSPWEHDIAVRYVMESPSERTDVRAWILEQLAEEYPFNVMDGGRVWAQVGRFAAVDLDIRAAANAFWRTPRNHLINLHMASGYVAHVADPSVAEALIGVLSEGKRSIDRYWALKALLEGWGREHPDVKPTIDALVDADDAYLVDLVAHIPDIILDKAAARERLLRLGARHDVRRDFLAVGLEACGCDHCDDEAVAAIIMQTGQSRAYSASYPLFRAFSAHPAVRAMALEQIRNGEGTLAALAAGYPDDPEFAPLLFDDAVPLPVELRTQIVEISSTGAAGTALEGVLDDGMREVDPELRARMVIARCRALPIEARPAAKAVLLAKIVSTGNDFQSVRAAALAGLATIGELGAVASLEEHGKPIGLETGGLIEGIPSVERLICERYADFVTTFGEGFSERFRSRGRNDVLGNILSVAPGASSAARAAFLERAARGGIPLTAQAVRAVAAERPRSTLLLARCWDVLKRRDRRNDGAMTNAEVGLVLREHFAGDGDVRTGLVEMFEAMPSISTAVPLAVFAPHDQALKLPDDSSSLGQDFADWTVVVHLAAARSDAAAFCALVEAMVTRPMRTQFDAQQITNLAVVERLQTDADLEAQFALRIVKEVHPSVSGSFARYLAAAGKLGPEARRRTLCLLQDFASDQRLPVAGYDAVADQWRAGRATLLDAVSAGLELA